MSTLSSFSPSSESSSSTTRTRRPPLSTPQVFTLTSQSASITSQPPFPSPTTDNGSNDKPFNASASLYLYTFLATLVLLLGISSAIVVRSLIMRRQHRRMIEEAIRNGTWVPSSTSARSRSAAKKPRMFETWFPKADPGGPAAGSAASHGSSARGKRISHSKEEQEWDGIMPFSATYIDPITSNPISNPSTSHQRPPSTGTRQATAALTALANLWRRLPRPRRFSPPPITTATNTPPPTSPPNPPTTQNDPPPTDQTNPYPTTLPTAPYPPPTPTPTNPNPNSAPPTLRVAFLIAMPSPAPTPSNNNNMHDDEQELPHIEFGVADVEVAPRERDGGDDDDGRKEGAVSRRESADGEGKGG